MIVTGILNLLYSVILLIVSPVFLLPDVSIDANIASAIIQAKNSLAAVNMIAPVSTLLTVLGIVLAIEVTMAIYKIIMWVIRKIPGIN